jgi:hypothetical protein
MLTPQPPQDGTENYTAGGPYLWAGFADILEADMCCLTSLQGSSNGNKWGPFSAEVQYWDSQTRVIIAWANCNDYAGTNPAVYGYPGPGGQECVGSTWNDQLEINTTAKRDVELEEAMRGGDSEKGGGWWWSS